MKLGSHWWVPVLLIALSIGVGSMYLVAAFSTVSGHVIAPVDDAYITFQYARQIARGYPYQYNDGDPPTTGMSSPLFGFLLAGAYFLGFTGERLVAFSIGIGPVWLGLSAWLTHRLICGLNADGPPRRGWRWFAAILVVLTGTVQWGCLNGMETGLFTIFTLAGLDTFLARRVGWSTLWLGLAGLTRPEGLILAVVIWATTLIESLLRAQAIPYRQLTVLGAAVGVSLIPLGANWMLTGVTAASGLQAKSWWYNVPYYPREFIRSTLRFYREIVIARFLGWSSPENWFLTPGLLLLTGLGWIGLGWRRRWRPLLVTLLWFFVGTLSTSTLITATWHMGRYQVPFVPVAIALAVSGLAFAWRRLAPDKWQQALLSLIALFLLITSVYVMPRFTGSYEAAVDTLARQHLAVVNWLKENTPPDARIGILDAGMLRYLGERPTYDLVGLTTANAAIPWRHGAGSVFELVEHSPARPNYFVVFPDIFSVPYLTETGLFAEELFRVEIPDVGISSPSEVQQVWRADWSLVDSGDQIYQPDVLMRTAGLTIVDALDVADMADEAAHSVTWWQDVHRTGFPTELHQLAYRVAPDRQVIDGGRLLTGGIAFDVATDPQEALWIVARLHAREGGAVRVEVDGQHAGQWRYPPVPGEWLETLFRVPAGMVAGSRSRVVLSVDTENPDLLHYAPYYFWFLQGDLSFAAIEIKQRVNATFDKELALLGFDLPQAEWRPGDMIPIALYWQALKTSDSDAKGFVHLYDTQGRLGPQSDGWAYYDTRPPYTWVAGETVVDPRTIALPPDIAPGMYSIEAGLYPPDSGRLPAYVNGVRQFEERVVLATIEVTE